MPTKNTMKPSFPIISIYNDRGLNIFDNDSKFRTISTLTFLKQNPEQNNFYDKAGDKWTFSFVNPNIKDSFKTRFLANTFYNPTIKVELEWRHLEKYRLNDLINHILKCVDQDDDIITQFEEAETIKNNLEKSQTYEEIIQTLKKLVFKNNLTDK
jgi:hypothetical protein